MDGLTPEATERERRGSASRARWSWLLLGAGGALLIAGGHRDVGWLLVTSAFFWLFQRLLVLPHELGHAFFARLAGLEVFEVSVGFGRIVWSRRWRGVLFAVRELGGGFMRAAGPQATHQGLRNALSAFGGPATNLALLVAYIPLASYFGVTSSSSLLGAAGNGFFWANLYMLAGSLIPHVSEGTAGPRSSGGHWNDGMIIRHALFASAALQRRWRETYYSMAADRAREEIGAAEELAWAERGVEAMPDSFALRYAVGAACMELERTERARGVFRQLLALPALDDELRLVLKNNVAYADLLLGEDLDEADRFSAEAAAAPRPLPYALGTRGAALIRMDRCREALPLLERAYALHEVDANRAIAAALLAIALARLGSREAAAEQVALAASLDPTCKELRLARAVVDAEAAANQ